MQAVLSNQCDDCMCVARPTPLTLLAIAFGQLSVVFVFPPKSARLLVIVFDLYRFRFFTVFLFYFFCTQGHSTPDDD